MEDTLNFKQIEEIILSGGYLTSKQAAVYLGVTVKSLADYRSKKRQPYFIKRLNAIRYPAQSIIDFIIKRNEAKYLAKYDILLSATLEHGTKDFHSNSQKYIINHYGKTYQKTD